MAKYSWAYGSSRYELVKNPLALSQAVDAATRAGGYLVEVNSSAENKNIFENISPQISGSDFADTSADDGGGSAYVWLGGSDQKSESAWKWITSDSPISLSREEWGSGSLGREPDNSYPGQDGLALGLENWPAGYSDNAGYGNAGSWNDIAVSNKLFYVIEFDQPEEVDELNNIKGSGKSDKLQGSLRDDVILGGKGDDTIKGAAGNDTLKGASGNDYINGGLGNDYLNGGSGRDTAQFSSRNNRIKLNTKKFQNTRDGKDRLISIENVNAGSGNDVVIGNKAANRLNGQKGNDRLYGGGGKDLLIGGGGKDKVWGQGGPDTFRIKRGTGYIIIKDFSDGADRIHLGSGRSDINFRSRGDDLFVYQRKDLLAIVEDVSAGDLHRRGSYLV